MTTCYIKGMEFLFVITVSFFLLIAVAVAFTFGRPPVYRPDRELVLNLLIDVMDKKASIERWELFLSLPISHDPKLEEIRQRCLVIAYGDDADTASGEGIDGALFDREGMQRIMKVSEDLNQLIYSSPISKRF